MAKPVLILDVNGEDVEIPVVVGPVCSGPDGPYYTMRVDGDAMVSVLKDALARASRNREVVIRHGEHTLFQGLAPIGQA